MLVMAIEAARQLANTEKKIVGYQFKEIVFGEALIIPATLDGIEIEFYLRPAMNSNFARSTVWNEFKLCSYDNNEWRDHCRGNISIEYGVEPAIPDRGPDMKKSAEHFLYHKQEASQRCNISVDPSSLYEICKIYGLTFGPAFQNLTSIRYNMQKEAVACVQIKEAVKPNDTTRKYVIHPTTLDGILQTIFPALSNGGQEPIQTVIPSFIRDLWISSNICRPDGAEAIHTYAKAKKRGFREAECTIVASDPSSREICASVRDFRVTSFANKDASQELGWRRLCFNVDWRPDIDLLDVQQAKHLFRAPKTSLVSPPDQRNEDLEFIGFYFISKSLEHVEANNITPPKEHLQKYMGWMKHQIDRYENGTLLHGRPEWTDLINDKAYVDKVLQSLEDSLLGRLIMRMGPNLSAILSGDADPLELIFKDDLVLNMYRWDVGVDIVYEKIEQYVEAMCHKNPRLNILEIGAGTGATTLHIFETLTRHGEEEKGAPRYSHYMYTDMSPSFFEKAEKTFKDHLDRMAFKVLDIEHDPVEQGFEEGVYDLVVASMVSPQLHKHLSWDIDLVSLRSFMRPRTWM
jgi:Polyketide synthase dehydratase/Methyltransferase domain